ncbi:hypothetical protein GCM10010964_19430 [Caldovatus sediminis]|uniref:PRC-barrel domain-containing protein n=1 Tax=Caldovatus sediminis TaxID=2041189 RepID=A0A8J3EC17_9PROT|nr:PRC-barrel domain-containing protein [Caldovatus sediminis]GGG31592.1 hypothetical protein GCM10010964_19430 [Caldovatus sediminis]
MLMLTRKTLLGMTAAAGFAAVPALALGQTTTGGSSAQPQTTQTMPQQGPLSGAPGAATTAPTAAPTAQGLAVDRAQLREGRRASKVIGSTVYGGSGNDSIGSVDDLIIPRGGGNPVAVLSVGGFLGIGAKLVAVPYERLQFDAERERWVLPGATRESLEALPIFAYDTDRATGTATGADRPAARPDAMGGGIAPASPPPARTQ